MAQAELGSVDVGQVEHGHGSGALPGKSPYMPHLALSQEELDELHPSLVPPEDERLDDLVVDDEDPVYQKGMRLAGEIRDETSLRGRTRRPLIAQIEEQQQRNISSSKNRTRTIRPFGGGVISGAAASMLVPLSTTLRITTNATNYTTTVAAAVVGDSEDVVAIDEDGDMRCGECLCACPSPFLHKPFVSSIHAQVNS